MAQYLVDRRRQVLLAVRRRRSPRSVAPARRVVREQLECPRELGGCRLVTGDDHRQRLSRTCRSDIGEPSRCAPRAACRAGRRDSPRLRGDGRSARRSARRPRRAGARTAAMCRASPAGGEAAAPARARLAVTDSMSSSRSCSVSQRSSLHRRRWSQDHPQRQRAQTGVKRKAIQRPRRDLAARRSPRPFGVLLTTLPVKRGHDRIASAHVLVFLAQHEGVSPNERRDRRSPRPRMQHGRGARENRADVLRI